MRYVVMTRRWEAYVHVMEVEAFSRKEAHAKVMVASRTIDWRGVDHINSDADTTETPRTKILSIRRAENP